MDYILRAQPIYVQYYYFFLAGVLPKLLVQLPIGFRVHMVRGDR